jgi:ribulose-phosphate 3-epimerase
MSVRICPSILSADFANFESELATIDSSDLIHVDVMDNHFVPNLTFGLDTVRRLQQLSTKPLDVHLMIEDVDRWALDYADLGVFSITFHAEATDDAVALAQKIRAKGCCAGLALKPGTAIAAFEQSLSSFDQILVMTVEPGFGGQSLIEETLPKVSEVRKIIDRDGLSTWLQVDGGIDRENIARVAKCGADTFVAGSAVFKHADRNHQINLLRAAAESA